MGRGLVHTAAHLAVMIVHSPDSLVVVGVPLGARRKDLLLSVVAFLVLPDVCVLVPGRDEARCHSQI